MSESGHSRRFWDGRSVSGFGGNLGHAGWPLRDLAYPDGGRLILIAVRTSSNICLLKGMGFPKTA